MKKRCFLILERSDLHPKCYAKLLLCEECFQKAKKSHYVTPEFLKVGT